MQCQDRWAKCEAPHGRGPSLDPPPAPGPSDAARNRSAVRRFRLRTWPPVLALGLLVLAAPAPAQQREPLPLVVRPRATEGSVSEEARARQERLMRRMEQADYLFRNICRNC